MEQALQYDPNSIGALRGLVGYDLYRKQPAQALARINAQIAKSPQEQRLLRPAGSVADAKQEPGPGRRHGSEGHGDESR